MNNQVKVLLIKHFIMNLIYYGIKPVTYISVDGIQTILTFITIFVLISCHSVRSCKKIKLNQI